MEELEKFVELIQDIGFVKSLNTNYESSKILTYNYNHYMIAISVYSYKWAIFLSGDVLWGKDDYRNFTLDNINLLKYIFKSEFRDSKLKELGI